MITAALARRKGLADESLRQGHQPTAAKSLQHPHRRQEFDVGSQRAKHRSGDEEAECDENHLPAAERVAEAPIDRGGDGIGNQVRHDHPRDPLDGTEIRGDDGSAVATMVWSATARNIGSMIEGKIVRNSGRDKVPPYRRSQRRALWFWWGRELRSSRDTTGLKSVTKRLGEGFRGTQGAEGPQIQLAGRRYLIATSARHRRNDCPGFAFVGGERGRIAKGPRDAPKLIASEALRPNNGPESAPRVQSAADGHATDYDTRENKYWMPINGEWMVVPPEAVVSDEGIRPETPSSGTRCTTAQLTFAALCRAAARDTAQ